jgi:hypothetical protein
MGWSSTKMTRMDDIRKPPHLILLGLMVNHLDCIMVAVLPIMASFVLTFLIRVYPVHSCPFRFITAPLQVKY